jgi:predicted RNA-binding protein with RPS1 domain
MSNIRYSYADTVEVKSIDSGQTVSAEILDFKPENSLSVSINRQIKLVLKYDKNKKHYLGRAANMEFVSAGPEKIITAQGRRG